MAHNEKGYIDPLLTGFVVDYAANLKSGLIARQLFTPASVDKDDAKYPYFGKDNLVLPEDNINDFEGRAKRTDLSGTMVPIHCTPHALQEGIDVRKNRLMDGPFKTKERDAASRIASKLLLREEIRVAGTVAKHSNSTTLAGTGSAVGNFWKNSGGDPFAVAAAARSNLWFEPNTLVLSYDVYLCLKQHSAVIAKLGSSETKVITREKLAEVFEVKTILVGEAQWPGARRKANGSVTMTRIWSNIAAFAYVDPADQAVTCGKIFLERQAAVDVDGFLVRTWHDPSVGMEGTDIVQVGLASTEDIIAADCIYVVKSVLE
jgi:hypothetical protein